MLAALQDAGVTMLVDVRHSPCASDPGKAGNYIARPWNLQIEGGIAAELRAAGIEYRWLVELGNPQKRDPNMAVLKAHLQSGDPIWPVNRGLTLLHDLVGDPSRRCAILCACGEYKNCHRRAIAEHLSSRYFDGKLTIINLDRGGPVDCTGIPARDA